jgi:hypothetical protein
MAPLEFSSADEEGEVTAGGEPGSDADQATL